MLVQFLLLFTSSALQSNDFGANEDPGTCICDLTVASCDLHCCCDLDCDPVSPTQALISLWSTDDIERNTCVNEKLSTWGQQYCVKRAGEYVQNAGNKAKTLQDSVSTLLCVEVDNSPFQGRFYKLTGEFDVNIDTVKSMEILRTDYTDTLAAQPIVAATSFQTGEKMISYLNENLQFGSIWPIPGPDSTGLCSDLNPAKWLIGQQSDPCVRTFTLCTDPTLDYTTYTAGLKIASSPAFTGNFKDLVPVVVRKLSLVQATGMVEVLSTTTTGTPYGSNCICSGVVLEAHYTVLTNPENTALVSVFADLVTGTTSSCSVIQRFSLSFQSNTVVMARSGNPGYLPGLPVLFKSTAGSVDIVNLKLGGVNADGSCNTQGAAYYLSSSPTLTFRSELIYTCFQTFTYSQLQQYCESNPANYDSMFFALKALPAYVAMFGNADFTNIDDFLPLNLTTGFASVWDESSGACNLTHTMVIELVTAEIGAASNPQPKIVDARVYFRPGT